MVTNSETVSTMSSASESGTFQRRKQARVSRRAWRAQVVFGANATSKARGTSDCDMPATDVVTAAKIIGSLPGVGEEGTRG
ncbi:hypothetical protein EASAB2608_05898 [Streptomyces sp. EAS-AB2608]|nr:hypothetical protein EASAB2608_05898 [Streptomyces sp. EAS-AB2608]